MATEPVTQEPVEPLGAAHVPDKTLGGSHRGPLPDESLTYPCAACDQDWPCDAVRLIELLDEARALLALRPSGSTGDLADRIPWFQHGVISHGADRPDCRVCRWLAAAARTAGSPAALPDTEVTE